MILSLQFILIFNLRQCVPHISRQSLTGHHLHGPLDQFHRVYLNHVLQEQLLVDGLDLGEVALDPVDCGQ